jgi:transcriptional regulator with XRE-family HTH domain
MPLNLDLHLYIILSTRKILGPLHPRAKPVASSMVRMRRLRDQTGLSQKKFAKRCGLGESTIRQLERDDKNKDAPTSIRPTTLQSIVKGAELDTNHPDILLLHELAWERQRQKMINAIAPLLAPISDKKWSTDIPLNGGDNLSEPKVLTNMEDVADFVISMLAQAASEKRSKIVPDEILVTTLGESSQPFPAKAYAIENK